MFFFQIFNQIKINHSIVGTSLCGWCWTNKEWHWRWSTGVELSECEKTTVAPVVGLTKPHPLLIQYLFHRLRNTFYIFFVVSPGQCLGLIAYHIIKWAEIMSTSPPCWDGMPGWGETLLLRGANHRCWSHLGCSGWNSHIFIKVSFRAASEEF